MITPIPSHVTLALARLIGQYANSPTLQGLIQVFSIPVQQIEGVLADLNSLRQLANAVGQQLDNLGKIIGLARTPGDTDAHYRQLLYAEVKVNTSQGQPEQAIQTFQLFTGAQLVILDEDFPGEVRISSEFHFADQAAVDMMLNILGRVLPAGVRPSGLIEFDSVAAFSYAGALPGAGYGDTGNGATGGKYANLRTRNTTFQYAGSDPTGGGYGSYADPLVGGKYQSL